VALGHLQWPKAAAARPCQGLNGTTIGSTVGFTRGTEVNTQDRFTNILSINNPTARSSNITARSFILLGLPYFAMGLVMRFRILRLIRFRSGFCGCPEVHGTRFRTMLGLTSIPIGFLSAARFSPGEQWI